MFTITYPADDFSKFTVISGEEDLSRYPDDICAYTVTTAGDLANVPGPVLINMHNAANADQKVERFSSRKAGAERVFPMLPRLATTAPKEVELTETTTEPATVAVAKKRGRKHKYNRQAKINVLVAENPRKKGKETYERFALYRTGMTVDEFVQAGGREVDITFDIAHNYIALEGNDEVSGN